MKTLGDLYCGYYVLAVLSYPSSLELFNFENKINVRRGNSAKNCKHVCLVLKNISFLQGMGKEKEEINYKRSPEVNIIHNSSHAF